MSSSLAEQLRRLKAPQTLLLVDSKKRASILFDPKEAALKDRETIFDIGYSGLKELIALNPSFVQFESTLFDKNARDMQRAVESREVNEHLNETIKKFLVHLSPYLLLQSSHKCLEWLIRRFNINEYNRDELMMLIFPYHETKIFVKCIQTMRLNDSNDKWNWLYKIQSPGVPLSKQAVLNRAASTSDNYFLDFVCKSIVYAANELRSKPNTLQVFYAFYCTTVIGALELAEISEAQITIIYSAVSKGLKSNSVDFCAASMMIIGQMVSKTKLHKKWLESIVRKLLNIQHPKLHNDIVILLVLIYRNQPEIQEDVPRKCSDELVHNKWIAAVLAQIYAEGVHILPFFVPLLGHCLRRVQTNHEHRKHSKALCTKLLSECFFKSEDAAAVVRCALESYVLSENEVITIDSDQEEDSKNNDGEDVEMREAKKVSSASIKVWYTQLLKNLERKYSSTFDTIVKELIRSPNGAVSENKKDSLKAVLSFLLTIVCTDDKVNLFEKLYHYNAQYRAEAIKYLVKNLEKMSFSDDSKGLLQNSIAERITDDSPTVVGEALKFESATLIKIVGRSQLRRKLIDVLERTLTTSHLWELAGLAAIKHLTSKEMCHTLSLEASTSIFMIVLPFLLQAYRFDLAFVHQIMNSGLAEKIPFILMCKTAVGASDDKQLVCETITKKFESKDGLPPPAAILAYVKTLSEEELTVSKAFYAVLVLSQSIGEQCPSEISHKILKLIERFESSLKVDQISDSSKWMVHAMMGVYPLNLNIVCIKNIVQSTKFMAGNSSFSYKIFEYLIAGMHRNRSQPTKQELYVDALEYFLARCYKTASTKIQFLSIYFVVEFLNDPKARCDTSLQIFAIEYLNGLLETLKTDAKINLKAFIRILSGLRSPSEGVRRATFDTLVASAKIESKYAPLIAKLMQRSEEIRMDANQLPLILHTILQNPSTKELRAILSEFVEFIDTATAEKDDLYVACLLEALTHVNTVDLLRVCSGKACNILKEGAAPLKANTKNHTKHPTLTTYRSIIVRNFLMRFTRENIEHVNKEPVVWLALLKSIEAYAIYIERNGKLTSVTSVTVSVFDEDMFSVLNQDHQQQMIYALVNSATFCENPDLTMSIGKFFKQITIDAKLCVNLLDQMVKCTIVGELPAATSSLTEEKCVEQFTPESTLSASELLKVSHWKCGVTWLEFLQNRNKQKTLKQHLLVPPLFAILQKCLALEDQSSVEYTKQLILSCILNVCTAISPDGAAERKLLPESVFKIESVVKCIRGTQNPQTHHHALQLLAHSAKMFPDQVLHNMMDIFTFMGSSVVRHDDAYSFQIISKIIASIIPTLVQHNERKTAAHRTALVVPVLKVFSDIVLDVPEHRRLPLYVQLIDTLGANDHLWMFLAVLIESHVMHESKERQLGTLLQKQSTADEEPRRIEIALALAKEFSSETIVITATKMLRFLQKLPNKATSGGDGDGTEKVSPEIAAVFNVNSCTNRELRYYKYACIQYVGNLTSSTEFVNKIAQLSDDETKQMKPYYQDAIISVLTLIPDVSKAAENKVDASHIQYWKALLHHCYDILENVISLLSPNMVLVVVEGLLSHKLPSVRRKVIELLNNKLQFKTEFFAESDEENLIRLLDPLTNIVESIIDESKLLQSASAAENSSIQQISLLAIKLLSKQLAQKQPAKFKGILETLIEILRKAARVPRIILATVILCLAELCSNLRAHSIAYLPRFMRIFLPILQEQVSAPFIASNDHVLTAIIAAVLKIVSTLPLFLSPYLVDLIISLCQIWDRVNEQPEKDARLAAVEIRLTGIWEKLSSTLQLRVLLPSIDQSYKQLIADGKRLGIGPLMQLLKQTLEQQSAATIGGFMGEITSFFIDALQFRSENNTDIEQLEDKIIGAFIAVTLKLSEGSFRPLYCRIYDWAFRTNGPSVDRAITFYKLSNEVAKALKSLYVLFASDVTQNATEYLTELNTETGDAEKCSLLIQQIVGTLYQIFLHDSQGFVNGSRFEALLQPLVDQIENEIVLHSSENKELLSKCLAQLGIAVNDDIQWKQLNYQILMKTRNNNSEIRLFALKVCVELASKLGEDYMPLLPETVPFLSELLEDENSHVEKECQRSVQELERILGEPLQKYF